jgi:hypothetical protein
MKKTIVLALLIIASRSSVEALTFGERAELARKAEDRQEVSGYLYQKLFPAIETALADAMASCTKNEAANLDSFTIIADIDNTGHFINVDVQPETNTSKCFAESLKKIGGPAPGKDAVTPLPIVIDMEVRP